MTHIITSLCLRDGGCKDVCPVEAIVPGKPVEEWPLYYIDADTCIDCGACEAECPYGAIFPEEDVPSDYTAKGGEYLNKPAGTAGCDTVYDGENSFGDPVHLEHTRVLEAGEVIDLTPDIEVNAEFFASGPGFDALED